MCYIYLKFYIVQYSFIYKRGFNKYFVSEVFVENSLFRKWELYFKKCIDILEVVYRRVKGEIRREGEEVWKWVQGKSVCIRQLEREGVCK